MYEFARELAAARGPLRDEVWMEIKKALQAGGQEMMAELVQVVGWYAYNCTVVNAFDTGISGTDG